MNLSNANRRPSLVHARLESIIASNTPYKENYEETKKNKEGNQMEVYLRIKNVPYKETYEIRDTSTLLYNSSETCKGVYAGNATHNIFKFTKIFGPKCTQSDIFDEVVQDKLLHFMNGYNCSILTYGASGSGKTFTIIGTSDSPGVIPKSLEFLFRSLPNISNNPKVKPQPNGDILNLSAIQQNYERNASHVLLNNVSDKYLDINQHIQTYKSMQQRISQDATASITFDTLDVDLNVWVTFAEIYNENIYDLLKPLPNRNQKLILNSSKDSSYINNLNHISVCSGLEAYKILQYGVHNLQYASTSINQRSSRSHSIFSIKLVQSSPSKRETVISSFNFCDLAGCERSKKTNNVGNRLKESNNINMSLMVLGRCLSLIRYNQKRNLNKIVPFRESKLTRLFQHALMGKERISMIVNITPTKDMYQESLHVLNFSAIAKDVVLEKQEIIKHQCSDKFRQYLNESSLLIDDKNLNYSLIENLEDELRNLEEEIQLQHQNNEKDQNYVKEGYEKIINETRDFWKTRLNKLEEELKTLSLLYKPPVIEISSDEDDIYIKEEDNTFTHLRNNLIRKHKSIINISSDENETFNEEDTNTCIMELKSLSENLAHNNSLNNSDLQSDDSSLKEKIELLKDQIRDEEEQLSQLKIKNESLKDLLKDATDAQQKLENNYSFQAQGLCKTIVHLNEIIDIT